MRLHRFLAALLLGLPMATPIPVAAEDAPLAPEVQRRANSGTLGCVGLIRWDEMQTLAGLVQRRNV